jgi:hypothetical protein
MFEGKVGAYPSEVLYRTPVYEALALLANIRLGQKIYHRQTQ